MAAKKAKRKKASKVSTRKVRKSRKVTEPGDVYGIGRPRTETFSSGCTILDCALGGGWAKGRVANIIGDKSSGKTLLTIEGFANFAADEPDADLVYVEAEAAYDIGYAESLGLPVDRVQLVEDIYTVEDLYEDLDERLKSGRKMLYVVDSLDALSDRSEMDRAIDKGSYGQNKSKKMSELFRRHIKPMKETGATVFIVSQVRSNIGVTFGESLSRSGGRALDFYATHAVWLAHKGRIKQTRNKVERVVGVDIRAMIKKNKLGPPFREADFPIYFGYGVEDLRASLKFLVAVDRTDAVGMSKDDANKLALLADRLDPERYAEEHANVTEAVVEVWREIEEAHRMKRRKYAPKA